MRIAAVGAFVPSRWYRPSRLDPDRFHVFLGASYCLRAGLTPWLRRRRSQVKRHIIGIIIVSMPFVIPGIGIIIGFIMPVIIVGMASPRRWSWRLSPVWLRGGAFWKLV